MYAAMIEWTNSDYVGMAAFNNVQDAVKVYEMVASKLNDDTNSDQYFSFNCDSGLYTIDIFCMKSITLHTIEEARNLRDIRNSLK